MIKLKNILTEAEVSKELWYHVQNNISLEECVFRYGSKKYFLLMNEAKSLMNEGIEFDSKTKRIKKVSFGSGGLRAKINNPKARNAFAKRHRCTTATYKTTARYWSCRLPRYAKQLGLSVKNPGGFW